jgi:hypothetical protein
MGSMNWLKPSQAPWLPSNGRLRRRPARRKSGLSTRKGKLQGVGNAPHKRGPGRPPRAAASLEELVQEAQAARQEFERISAQRERVAQSIRTIGHVYHVVDLERGVRRNGRLIAADIREQIGIIRSVAQHEGLTQTCLDRIDKAERVVPKMQATIGFVSGYVRQQVRPDSPGFSGKISTY